MDTKPAGTYRYLYKIYTFANMLSVTEENYLKALLRITSEEESSGEAGTNQLASKLNVRPATATDMLKRLREKGLVNYEKYGKITLTDMGRELAVSIIRKHRLWETFLCSTLGFRWDEVHDIAEQLEHIQSDKLIERLDNFLGYPQFDPHGDIIPSADGAYISEDRQTLAGAIVGAHYAIVGVKDNSAEFLTYLNQIGIGISSELLVFGRYEFDRSIALEVEKKIVHISEKVAKNIFIGEIES